MKKALKSALGSIVVSLVLTCMVSLVMLDIMKEVINKENIAKSIQQFNISDLLTTNLEQYEGYLGTYSDSTNLLDETKLNSTSFSQEDINEIINSDEYADLLSTYIMDEGLFNSVEGLEDFDYEKILESISKDDIKNLLNESGVEYNESDVDYITNTIPAVVPTVAGEVGGNLALNTGSLDLTMFNNLFSNKTMYVAWVFLIVCIIGVVFIYYDKYYFSIILALLSALMCIGIKVITKVLNKGAKMIPEEYESMVEIFTKPLYKCLDKDFKIFLGVTVLFIIIYVLLNFVITKTSIGDSIKFLHLANDIEDEDENNLKNVDEFADIDFSSIQVTDIDKEIDDFF